MKRLIAIGLAVLNLVGFSAHAAFEMSDSDKQAYLDWIKKSGVAYSYALAVAPNGGLGYGWGDSIYVAKRNALRMCRNHAKTSGCKVMDVDGKSVFIMKRSSSASTQSDHRKIQDELAALKETWGLPTASTSSSTRQIYKRITYTDGSKYEGDISNGVPHGQGTYTWADGNVYIGEFKNNVMHGVGTFNWIDGRKYFGDWKVGKMDGHGTYTWPNGKTFVGEAKDDKPWNVVQYSASGVVEGTYSNGKWCAGCKPTAKQLETPSTTTSSNSDAAIELEYWNVVKNNKDINLLQAYLDEYPNGKFAPLVRLKIKKLKSD